KHYDVVVLGRSLGALVAGALLSRRDFRVLVLGQGQRPPSYRWDRHVLRRNAFTMLFASSPAWKRVLVELAQTQTFRRRAEPLDPMVQLLLSDRRIDLPPDLKLFEREIEREFPEVRRVIDELYAELGRANAAVDAVFEHDAVWPPGTFWERRETGRLVANLPYARAEPGFDLLGDLPATHAYRALTKHLVAFAAHSHEEALPALALARLHGSWSRGVHALSRGEDELSEFLLERIEAHGGTCRLSERAVRIDVDRGGVSGVLIDGEASVTGAGFVVSDGTGERLAELSQGKGILKRAERDWPAVVAARSRFVVSIVVRSEGLPEPLGREAIVVPSKGSELALHVVRMNPALEPEAPEEARGESLLVVEALIPHESTAMPLDGVARERVLEALGRAFPDLHRHIVVVDSPHDGRPLWSFAALPDAGPGRGVAFKKDVERIHLKGASPTPLPMAAQWRVDGAPYLSLAGEPVRGPIGRTLLVGSTVLPALGQEGELLAAWSAVRLVTRADGQKERIRRAMWSKVELG
ncbi:MAG TPA: phytoene dehydrogenase, partial [Polyangiaceae bacterium]|nr:phytoene dehydrogenase [Polyangiaceae bacterium]